MGGEHKLGEINNFALNFQYMSPTAIVFASVLIIALIIFIAIKNQKDKKDLVNTLNNDYRKPTDEENDADIEKRTK